VTQILQQVREQGDRALGELSIRLDGIDLTDFSVPASEWDSAARELPADVRQAIDQAASNIRAFHKAGRPRGYALETTPGVVCQTRYVGIDRVGLYAPGGGTPLPSSVLMMGIPAQLAGCRESVLCTPPSPSGTIHGAIAYAARVSGIQSIFKVGGAQAIAAMAFGTETVPACDKIFGPGSVWVTEAKRQVAAGSTSVTIDMAAGPSEVLVVADEQADAELVAVDMAAQMEHGPDSQAILVTDCPELAASVQQHLQRLASELSRQAFIDASARYSRCLVVDDLQQAVDVANQYAAEHLIIQTRDPEALLEQVTAAGSVFLGPWTPEVLGDYCSGTNHVLPTCGLARSVNGLSTSDFMKRITVQRATPSGLQALAATATTLAECEQLTAHAKAVTLRQQKIRLEQPS
jgi:histidinol dehydrogenase